MKSYTEMIHRAALNYAGKGKPVFPCKPDKKPHTRHGCLEATTDPRKITAWWTRWPEALIGIATGKPSGFFVLDLDTYKPGAMTLEEFEEKYGVVSHTATVRTGRGGLQFYFIYPDGEEISGSAGKLGTHVDTRGKGNYAIAPPSVTESRYEWINKAPPAPIPPLLLEALRDEPRRKPSDGTRASQGRTSGGAESAPDDGGPIPDGTRDETLTRIAGRLHDGTRDLAQLEDALHEVNEARCIPPLPPEQVRKIARSVFRYEPCRRARREPSQDPETAQALAAIERALLAGEYKGKSGKTTYSIFVAALKLARKYGTLVDDGVRVEVSTRQLALAAAVSRRTIATKLKTMEGILRPDNGNVAPGKAGAIVLLTPRANLHHSTQQVSYIDKQGGCANWRAPLTAPRLRWSSPAYKPKKGVTPGTCRVRDTITTRKRDAVIRLGKSCEGAMDRMEIAPVVNGKPTMDIPALAAALNVKRPRDLTRRKNPETGKGRDGIVTRLEAIGVLSVVGDTVILADDWLEALDRERESAGEIALYQRDMRRYNEQSKAYRNRHKVKAERAPTADEMRETRESYPERRREAIKDALARLFREQPEYRGRRAGQITCRLPFFFDPDFPRGRDGMPKDAEVEAVLDGAAA